MTKSRAHLYSRISQQTERSSLARGAWATAKLTAFLAVVGVAGWFIFQDQVRTRLRSVVQEKVDESLVGSGVETAIGEARFFDGQGMLLTNVNASAPNISLSAYETFLSMPINTAQLVSGEIDLDSVEMRRVQLQVTQSANEPIDWSMFARLAEAFKNSDQESPRLIPISILDSKISFVDQARGVEKSVSDINLRMNPVVYEGRTILELTLTAASIDVRQFVLKGFVDPDSGEWNVELNLNEAILGTELMTLLPPSAREKLAAIEALSGHVNGKLYAHGNFKMQEVRWYEGSGNISRFVFQHHEFPSVVRNASATWQISPDGASINNIAGHLGASPFTAHFRTGSLKGPVAWRFNGKLDRFEVDGSEHGLQSMPEKTHRFLRDFRPRGNFDIDFDFHFDGQKVRKAIQTRMSDLAFNFARFPYPVENCSGVANWIDDKITYRLEQESPQRSLSVDGIVLNPGEDAIWRCDLKVEKGQLDFDEKLQAAFDVNPPVSRVIRAFNGHGAIAGSGRLERLVPRGEVQKRFDIDIVDMTIRHGKFPYTIEGVRGKIKTVNDFLSFEEFSGVSGVGTITCNGKWNPNEGLNVRYDCKNVQLDGRLRLALRQELKDVWDGFRPAGTVEAMSVFMTMNPQEKQVDVAVDAILNGEENGVRTSNLSINPTWFPYKLQNLAGKLTVGQGKVELREFQGQHDRTTVVCDGDGSYSNEGWDVRLSKLLALSLRADGPLLRALPESLATPIEFMKLQGLLNVHGTVTLAGQYRKVIPQFASNIPGQFQPQTNVPSHLQQAAALGPIPGMYGTPRVSMGWDARFDMNQAEMFLGIPLKNVSGMLKLIGQFDGENVECRGSLDLDSLTVYGAQITEVRGPIWFDNYQALAGGLINQVSGGVPSPSISGNSYGGIIKLDAAISSDKQGRFLIQTSLADGDLKQLSKEYSSGVEQVEGRTFAALRMQGDASGTHTCRGEGKVHVRDARLYELPPAMRLLQIFRVKDFNDVAFDSGDIFFSVTGENIDIDRMEFNGDVVSIIGNGRANTDHELDLNFYSVVGRNNINIPLISDLYRRGSQKFMWINVGGTIQNPKVTNEILPELNGPLKQLFQLETP